MTSFPLKITCPASGRAKSGKGRGRGGCTSSFLFLWACDCDGGPILGLSAESGSGELLRALRLPLRSSGPVARSCAKVGGEGTLFEVLQCKQV